MTELQATVEFSIELHKFYNVDLFQRGFYQVRVGLKVSPKLSVKIEVNLGPVAKNEYVYPPCIINGFGVSKTFQILYRNEEVVLGSVVTFKAHVLVESHKIEETLERGELGVQLELWFTEHASPVEGMSCVSSRNLQLNFSPARGLHYSLPVLFDYFHLAALTITIHSTLVALHQPCINTPRSAKPLFGSSNRLLPRHSLSTSDALFFGNVNSSKCVGSGNRLIHARHVHREVCRILLVTYQTLQGHLHEYMKLLPAWQQLKFETNEHIKRLQSLSEIAKACHESLADIRTANPESTKMLEGEEDFISLANNDIAQLCAENILLWQQFLETFTGKEPLYQHLAKIHHQLRVKRFAEGFFVADNPRPSAAGCYDANYQNYLAMAEGLRRSRYLAALTPLPVTCLELDGDLTTLPIIFEDQYQDVAEFARRRSGVGSSRIIDKEMDESLSSLSRNVKTEDCSCGIAAILESRSLQQQQSASRSQPLPQVQDSDENNRSDEIVQGTLIISNSGTTVNTATLPNSARYSRSLDQLRIMLPIVPKSASSLATAGAVSPTIDPTNPFTKKPLGSSTSCFSMPGVGDVGGGWSDNPQLLCHISESMPNLQAMDSPPLYRLGDATIEEEQADAFPTALVTPPPEVSVSPMSSSLSNSVTSEQSGWVSNSSRRSTSSSSPAQSIDGRPDYSTLRGGVIPLSQLDCEALRLKLEQLNLVGCTTRRLERSCDELRLPPPKQFRDDLPPPEPFRDPPRQHSYDSLLHHAYDGAREMRKIQVSEARERRVRRRRAVRPSRSKPVSDEGFDEIDVWIADSDTSTVDSISTNANVRDIFRTKHPFQGYLFKEDVETLKRTFETDAEKVISTSAKNTTSVITKEMSKTFPENVEKDYVEMNRETLEPQCACYEDKVNMSDQDATITFIKAKEEFKRHMNFTGLIYSDFPTLASTLPYFHISDEYRIFSPGGLHLIVCVHGLDGNSADLRLVKTYLELGLPGANLEFLMSERNQGDTFSDFDTMTDKLVSEILYHIEACGTIPSKISFIGHSLGTVIIRSAITRAQVKHLVPRFHTFLSLSGPHLGTLYNNSGLVNMGMWFMQKWKKSGSLLQLSLRDAVDMRMSFLYKLSQRSNLHHFRHVLLCGSSQDRYVPMHSARIELCKAAIKDTTPQGAVYREMVHNVMYPIIHSADTTLVRYDIHHALPNTANSLIGRAAHIAVLDSELFIEKFFVVTGLKYFRCYVLLLLPQLVSKRGRQALTAYAFLLSVTGPARNSVHNLGVLSNSLACAQEQVKRSMKQIVDMVREPISALNASLKKLQTEVKDVVKPIKDVVTRIIRVFKAIFGVIESVTSWLGSIVSVCNKETGTPYQRCVTSFDDAITDCQVKMGVFQFVCSVVNVVKPLCYAVKAVDVLCVLMDVVTDIVVKVAKRRLSEFKQHVVDMFAVSIQVKHSVNMEDTASRSVREVVSAIVSEITKKLKNVKRVSKLVIFIPGFALVFLFLKVFHYRHKFLTCDHYDNRYVTRLLVEIDLMKMRQNAPTALPLELHERALYTTATSLRLVRGERKRLVRAFLFLTLTTVQVCTYIAADYGIFKTLIIIREQGLNAAVSMDMPMAGVEVVGEGVLARLYHHLAHAFQPPAPFLDFDPIACLPEPNPPDLRRYIRIALLLVASWFLVLLEPYCLRLRHVVMSHYYPERSRQRATWLHNHIILARGPFTTFARHRLISQLRQATSLRSPGAILQKLVHRSAILRKIIGSKISACAICGSLEGPETELSHCPAPDCCGLFCQFCWPNLPKCVYCYEPFQPQGQPFDDGAIDSSDEEYEESTRLDSVVCES